MPQTVAQNKSTEVTMACFSNWEEAFALNRSVVDRYLLSYRFGTWRVFSTQRSPQVTSNSGSPVMLKRA